MNIDQLHSEACRRGQRTYTDPRTGYSVFTALSLEQRDNCCGCGCRHCPYGHELVPDAKRNRLIQDPWMDTHRDPEGDCDVLSWSGGKDSFLALVALAKEAQRDVTLLTTFDGRSGQVAHQEIHVNEVREQARRLQINLMLTPLFPENDYLDRVALALQLIHSKQTIRRLAFGDLHLEHVRKWREDNFGPVLHSMKIQPYFPIWNQSYPVLEAAFFASGAKATVSAVASPLLEQRWSVGDAFTPDWLDSLPPEVDRFGENGEFHTQVRPPDCSWRELSMQLP